MGQIFLSYAREDRTFAETLTRVLERAGHGVWWDRNLDSGEEFATEIEAELQRADAVLVAWSNNSVKSRWVRDEATAGGDTGRLIAVSLDGTPPPMGFRQFHSLDLVGWKGRKSDQRTRQLLQAVERRTKERGKAEAHAPRTPLRRASGRKALAAIAAAFVLIIAGGTIFALMNDRWSHAAPLKPTIALVPFTVVSSDADLVHLASQTRDSIAHTFSQSGLPVRLLSESPTGARPDVDFVIGGDLTGDADKVVATVRVDEVAHRVTVFSRRFEAGRNDLRDLPERIGAQMAGNLTWRAPLMMLDRRKPMDPSLLADLLQGIDFTADPLQAYQNVTRVAAKAPNLPIGQISVAFNTAMVLDLIPRGERPQAVATARRTAERALAMDPGFGDIHGTWCLLHSESEMAACEDRLRKGRQVDPDAPFLNAFLAGLLWNVGRFDEAVSVSRLSYTHDPYVPTKIAWMLRMLEYAGESEQARDLYRESIRWWPEYRRNFFRNRVSGLIDRGDLDAIVRLEQELSAKELPSGYVGSAQLAGAMRTKSSTAAKRACKSSADFWMQARCMTLLAAVGDQDGAYAIADKLYPRRVGRTPAETERIWLDDPFGIAPLDFVTSEAAAPMRQDPRYLALAERTGLLAYWRSGPPPDFCRKRPERICAQLLKR
jgi:TolB-like protein